MVRKPDALSGGAAVFVVTGLLMAFGGAPVAAQTSPWQTIAHWRMDETTGGLMRNSAPNSPDGIWHDVIPGRIGFMGRAYGFNGFSSYVEVPHAPIFDFGTNSIRVTARVLTTMPSTSTGGNDLIKKGYSAKSPLFNGIEYIATYPDLVQAFGADAAAGQAHYLNFGQAEGRIPYGFNPVQYLTNYADLQAAFGSDTQSALVHYIQNGFAEGRTDLAQ
jgi:hypothetical protein